jgi:hypothetical protein
LAVFAVISRAYEEEAVPLGVDPEPEAGVAAELVDALDEALDDASLPDAVDEVDDSPLVLSED